MTLEKAVHPQFGTQLSVRISVKVDYAVRAMVQLAAVSSEEPVKADTVARAQDIPLKFLLGILSDLKRARLASRVRKREKVDHVRPSSIDHRSHRTTVEVVQPSALEGESVLGVVGDSR